MKELGIPVIFWYFFYISSRRFSSSFESTWNLLLLASIDPKGQHPEDVFSLSVLCADLLQIFSRFFALKLWRIDRLSISCWSRVPVLLFSWHCQYNFSPQGLLKIVWLGAWSALKLQPPGNTGSVAASDVQWSAHNKKMERALKVQAFSRWPGILFVSKSLALCAYFACT